MLKNFRINGIVGWAAFRLKRGAYNAMERYILGCKSFADSQFKKFQAGDQYRQIDSTIWAGLPIPRADDPYRGGSFNCMTFAVNVYEQGCSPDTPFIPNCTNQVRDLKRQVDHPNAHIRDYMDRADDKGYFDHRLFLGKPEAKTNTHQAADTSTIRHHTTIKLV
jgi:hypothetical protein